MSTSDSRLDLLPDRLAALDVLLNTGDVGPLRDNFRQTPEDYQPQVDEFRILAARVLGVAPERVSRQVRTAVKLALFTLVAYEPDTVPDETGTYEVTPRSALLELIRCLRSRPDGAVGTTWAGDAK